MSMRVVKVVKQGDETTYEEATFRMQGVLTGVNLGPLFR